MAQVYFSKVCQSVKENGQYQSLWKYSPSGVTISSLTQHTSTHTCSG
jgi:hypothetical protein